MNWEVGQTFSRGPTDTNDQNLDSTGIQQNQTKGKTNAKAKPHCSALFCPVSVRNTGLLQRTSIASVNDTRRRTQRRCPLWLQLAKVEGNKRTTQAKFTYKKKSLQMCAEVRNLDGMSGFHHIPKYCRRKEFHDIAQPGPPPSPNHRGEVSLKI